eukprot:CAMPEP_0194312332 /NCGR_PEP_ID=MMETSP0171-20130528/9261_1 /TAXON_ID=218684 /ORGANISM="Corethron pennatum, Strain L29A3" /LENGTH=61 /DNA_ID=CAMNT_0039066807 /DNA_START=1002 /DNA_END=1187 /DNA_ORIENTATION=-
MDDIIVGKNAAKIAKTADTMPIQRREKHRTMMKKDEMGRREISRKSRARRKMRISRRIDAH